MVGNSVKFMNNYDIVIFLGFLYTFLVNSGTMNVSL